MKHPRPQQILVENFMNPNLKVISNPRYGYRARIDDKPIRLQAGALQLIVNERYNYLYSYWQLLGKYRRSTGVLTILDPDKVYRSRTTQRHYGYLLSAINRFGVAPRKDPNLDIF